ncbi:MAG: glycosyltransferase [Bifidobacteriaceae bacterium]|jgi:glycosyltransferase involved in cell wall biosynthesis|nr:glycosyltransferase [Bifidobacteriaceae bacterium]
MAPPRVDVSIVTSGHDVADARLHRQVAALRRAGLTVEVIGLGVPDDAPPGALVRTFSRGGRLGRLLLALAAPWRARGRVLVALDPDSTAGAYLRRVVAGGRRLRLVADVHEDYLALLRDRAWARGFGGLAGWAGGCLARLGLALAARADLTVVADAHLAPRAPRRLVVRNLPDLSMLPAAGAGAPDPRPRAIYVGDLRGSRGLWSMLEVARRAPGWRFDLVGPVAAADQARLEAALAADLALAGRVRLTGRLGPERAWRVAEGAWAGLLLLEQTAAFAAAMPSKVYEYLACGLPVVTTPLPRPAELVRRTGAGAVALGVAEAAGVLERWALDPEAYGAVRRAAQAAGSAQAPPGPQNPDMAAFAARLARLARPARPAELGRP